MIKQFTSCRDIKFSVSAAFSLITESIDTFIKVLSVETVTFWHTGEHISRCSAIPGGLLGVFDEAQSVCCNQGAAGANT